jgi:hypothetical protein
VIDDVTQVCLLATRGLTMFRMGNPEIGRQFYYDAFEKTRGMDDPNLNWIAILNYAREEIRIGSEYVESIMNTVARIPEKSDDMDIEILRDDVLTSYERYKQVERS